MHRSNHNDSVPSEVAKTAGPQPNNNDWGLTVFGSEANPPR